MRIVGGKYRGRNISAPPGAVARPTTDRVRESIFSILTSRDDIDFENARVIDLFAGSGALGIEALSRGAPICFFIEEDASARGAIRENVDSLGLIGQTRIHRRSALKLGNKPSGHGEPFTLAFLDPPYDKELASIAMASLHDGCWLASGALLVVEQAKKEKAPNLESFHQVDHRIYGDTQIGFFRYSS